MKTNCDIIRDLLPLYAEHITSEATNALVEEHLAECEACRAELEQMEQPVAVRPEAKPDAPLRRIRAALQRRSIRAAIGTALAALCALALIFWMGTACVPATTEQAQFWTYNRKENGADICILEAQGEGVWLDMEGTFSWGKPQITVRAMRYRFPGAHRVLTALVGSDRFSVWVMVSPTQLLTVDCADQTLYYRDGQQVDRYIVQENPDGTFDYVYGTDQEYGTDYKKGGAYGHRQHLPALLPGCVSVPAGPDPQRGAGRGADAGDFLQGTGRPEGLR